MSTSDRSPVEHAIAVLDEARKEVIEAEHALEHLLSELKVAPRAEKTSVSSAIETALQRLRSGRGKVEDAETVLAAEKP